MKLASLLLPLVLLTACAPTACAPIDKAISIANAPAKTVVDEKAVLAAEVAYGAALDTVIQGAQDGRITGQQAVQVAHVIQLASEVRPALHTALRAANQTDLILKFNDLKQLTAQLVAIGGK